MVSFRKLVVFGALPLVLLAAALSAKRHLLLKVPKIGFVLHALAGGPIPPYMEPTIFSKSDEWLKSGDVFVSVPAKSGTTWLLYTVNMLRAKGKLPEGFRDLSEEVPWPELVFYPGQPLHERIEEMNNISRRYPFNIYKTHYAPPIIPYRDDVKYIVSFRNLYDATASARPFMNNHQAAYAKMWGGFPPNAGQPLGPDEEWEKMLLVDAGNGVPLLKRFFLDLLNAWWPLRNEPNVLMIHYSDRLKDDLTQIKRIAKFLDISLTDDELASITKQVSYLEMKKVEDSVEMRHVYDKYKAKGLIPEHVHHLNEKKGSNMMNVGGTRKGIKELSPTLREGLKALADSHLSLEARDWVMNGGTIPN